MKLLLTTLALATALSAAPAQAGLFDALTGKDKAAEINSDAPLTVLDFVMVKGSSRLSGATRVVIPTFYVQFVRDQTIERKGRLGTDSYTTQVRGIDPVVLQTIADGLYESFVAELKAAGIEVVPTSALEADADFQELRKSARASPTTEEAATGGMRNERLQGVSLLVAAQNLPINVRLTADKHWLVGGASDGFKVSLVTAPVKLRNTLGVPLLNVRMTVALSALKGTVRNSGTIYSQYQSTSFEFDADFYPRWVESGTLVTVLQNSGDATFALAKPVLIKDLSAKIEKGGSGSRGSGLLGALGRAVGGSASMDADAYIDLPAEDFGPKLVSRGREVAHVLVQAMTQ